ncbi:hypothetical protein CcCBS67573_g09911, partial [Chytriomyces confervae]
MNPEAPSEQVQVQFQAVIQRYEDQLSEYREALHNLYNEVAALCTSPAPVQTTPSELPATIQRPLPLFRMPSVKPLAFSGNHRNHPAHEIQNYLDDYLERSHEICTLYGFAPSINDLTQQNQPTYVQFVSSGLSETARVARCRFSKQERHHMTWNDYAAWIQKAFGSHLTLKQAIEAMEDLQQTSSATLYTSKFNELISAIATSTIFAIDEDLDHLQQEAEKLDDLTFCHNKRNAAEIRKNPSTASTSRTSTTSPFDPPKAIPSKTPSPKHPTQWTLGTLSKQHPTHVSPQNRKHSTVPMAGVFTVKPKTTIPTTAPNSATVKPSSPPSPQPELTMPQLKPKVKKQTAKPNSNRFSALLFDNPPDQLTPVTVPAPSIQVHGPKLPLFQVQTQHSTPYADSPSLLICQGTINEHPVSILIDSGANPSFINSSLPFLQDKSLVPQACKIKLANGSIVKGQRTESLMLKINNTTFTDTRSFTTVPELAWKCRSPRSSPEVLTAQQFINLLQTLQPDDFLGAILPQKMKVTTSDSDRADESIRTSLPPNLQTIVDRYPDVFAPFEGLPPSRSTDMKIDVDPSANSSPPYRPIYPMSAPELKALQEELTYLLKHHRIRPSTSPFGAPVFFVKQKDKLRLVFDYRAVNRLTVKNRAALPNILESLDRLSKAKFFTKADCRSGFHQVRIVESDIPKTAFRTKYGHYEWVVMPFGLANAPGVFQTTLGSIFRDFIDAFLTVYIDDLLIFSETLEDHLKHIDQVLQRLQDHKLHLRLSKCSFFQTQLEYLGYWIARGSVSVLPSRTSSITDFEEPSNYSELRSFLGLANTVHRFVKHHAALIAPLSDILRDHKTTSFSDKWNDTARSHFINIKKILASPAMLAIFNPDLPVHLYTDWSARAVGGYIAQPDSKGIDQPIAYYSRKLKPEETRYHPYMGEILALVECLKHYRQYLVGNKVLAFTDHQSLRHILTQPKLRPVHHRWLADLLAYDFQIQWTPGEWNTIADALSRRRFATDASVQVNLQGNSIHSTVQIPESYLLLNTTTLTITDNLMNNIKDMNTTDPQFLEIAQFLVDPLDPETYDHDPSKAPKHLLPQISRYRLRDGFLHYVDKTHARLYVPAPLRHSLLEKAHSYGPAIHNNWERTSERLTRYFHWPKLHRDVQRLCQNCDNCQRLKVARHAPYGLLQPHDVPPFPWHTCSMDFMTKLPLTKSGYDALMVVVDSGTKRTRLIPCHTTSTARDIANLFESHIFPHHGIPVHFISDRDVKFTSNFWQELCKSLKIKLTISTSSHPQTDGQTEQKNDWILQALRHFVAPYQDDWDEHLPKIEFGINDTVNSSTGYTPFYLEYGRHPRSMININLPPDTSLSIKDIRAEYQVAKDRVRDSQDKYAAIANRKRLEAPFKVGDLVLVSAKEFKPPNLRYRQTNKLSEQYSGPYKIIELVGAAPSCKLALPSDWGVHPVFHPEKLKPYYFDSAKHPLDNQPIALRVIDKVLSSRILDGHKQVLIQWKDHHPVYNCWLNATPELMQR